MALLAGNAGNQDFPRVTMMVLGLPMQRSHGWFQSCQGLTLKFTKRSDHLELRYGTFSQIMMECVINL